MKDKEKRNKKESESTIGKIIYGFLLFMPLFAIGVTCITSFWNKEITSDNDIANIEYKYTSNEVNSAIDLINGHLYTFTLNQTPTTQQYISTASEILNITNRTNYHLSADALNGKFIRIDLGTTNITFRDEGYNNILSIPYNNITFPFAFDLVLVNYTSSTETDYNNYTYTNYNEINNVTITNQPNDFDVKNIFYYAVDKVTESPLFSWAENSIIYTTTNATCNALSITTPFIPLLLSYWLIISVMYFLYDIALMLIWVIHDRIHALKDSIT